MEIQEPRHLGGTSVPCSPLTPWCELISLLRPPGTYLRSALDASPTRADLLQRIGAKPQAGTTANTDATLLGFVKFVLQYLTVHEAVDILREFRDPVRWKKNQQVLWSGMAQEVVQRWADEHGLATLTTALGRLKDPSHDACLRKSKSGNAWSDYMKGASALFCWRIAQGQGTVLLVTPPPGERFHPSGGTNLQQIEGPIIAGFWGSSSLKSVDIVHPQVARAAESRYQLWPRDDVSRWSARFGGDSHRRTAWRGVKGWQPAVIARGFSTTSMVVPHGAQLTAMDSETDISLAPAAVAQVLDQGPSASSCSETSTRVRPSSTPPAASVPSSLMLPVLLMSPPRPLHHPPTRKSKCDDDDEYFDSKSSSGLPPDYEKPWTSSQTRKKILEEDRAPTETDRLWKIEVEGNSVRMKAEQILRGHEREERWEQERDREESDNAKREEKRRRMQTKQDELKQRREQELERSGLEAMGKEHAGEELDIAQIKDGDLGPKDKGSAPATPQAPPGLSTQSKNKRKKSKKLTATAPREPLSEMRQ